MFNLIGISFLSHAVSAVPKAKIVSYNVPSTAKEGEIITITVTLKNIGNEKGTLAFWLISDSIIHAKGEAEVDVNEQITLSDSFKLSSGKRSLTLKGLHKIGNVYYTDDTRSISIDVIGGEGPAVTSVELEFSSWSIGKDYVEYSVKVTPRGDQGAQGTVWLKTYLDGTLKTSNPYGVGVDDPFWEHNKFTGLSTGSHTLKIDAYDGSGKLLGSISKSFTIEPEKPPEPADIVLDIWIKEKDTNVAISGATVNVDGQSKTTDSNGLAKFTVKAERSYTISVFKDGYKSLSYTTGKLLGGGGLTLYLEKEVETFQTPILKDTYISPSSVYPRESFTGYYTIYNPNSYSIDVGLGLSIRRSGTTDEIVDTSHDTVVSVAPGTNTYHRTFIVPTGASPGSYDVALAIWSGQPGSSTQYDTSGWKSGELTVLHYGAPSISLSYTPRTIKEGETKSITLTFKNDGTATLKYPAYYWNDVPLTCSPSEDLPPGSSATCTVEITGTSAGSTISRIARVTGCIAIPCTGSNSYEESFTASFKVEPAEPQPLSTYLTLEIKPSPSVTQGDSVEFWARLFDPSGNVLLGKTLKFYVDGTYVDSGSNSATGWVSITYDTSGLSEGSHTVKVVFEGDSQYTSSYETQTLTVQSVEPQPPTAHISSIYPNPATQGENVHFSGYGSDPDGTIVAYSWRSSIDGFLSNLKSFSTSGLSPGEHTIYFKVKDDSGAWSEEATVKLVVNPEEKYLNLRVWANKDTLKVGEELRFGGKVTDQDGNPVGSAEVKMYNPITGKYEYKTTSSNGEFGFYGIYPDKTGTFTFSFKACKSGYKCNYMAYIASVCCETNLPDLTITSLTWTPSKVAEGDEVIFSFTIKNNGNADASDFKVGLYIDGVSKDSIRISSLKAGKSLSKTFNYKWKATSEPSDTHTVKIVADYDNRIVESDEGNNELSKSLEMKEKVGKVYEDENVVVIYLGENDENLIENKELLGKILQFGISETFAYLIKKHISKIASLSFSVITNFIDYIRIVGNPTKLDAYAIYADESGIQASQWLDIPVNKKIGVLVYLSPGDLIRDLTIKVERAESLFKRQKLMEINVPYYPAFEKHFSVYMVVIKNPIILSKTGTYYITANYGGYKSEIQIQVKKSTIKRYPYFMSKSYINKNLDVTYNENSPDKEAASKIAKSGKIPPEAKQTKIKVLVGGPLANAETAKYMEYFPVKVTNFYPGPNRGVVEVIDNPDGEGKIVLLAGSDRNGTRAAVEVFLQLEDLPEEPIFVKWKDGKAEVIEG